MKNYSKSIRARLQDVFDWHTPAPKHVVRMKNLLLVQVDVRKRVQPLKDQVHVLVRRCCGVHVNRGSVLPIGEPDPLQSRVVVLVKRIRDEAIAQEVCLNNAGYVRGMPFLDVRSGGGADGAELPFRVDDA